MYISHGEVYCCLDNKNSAISDFTKAIELRPENAEAYDRRGLSYVRKSKDYTLAIADYSRAIEIDNNMVSAYEHRGIAYKATEKYDIAIADLTKAIELGLNLGKVQEALNDALKKKEA